MPHDLERPPIKENEPTVKQVELNGPILTRAMLIEAFEHTANNQKTILILNNVTTIEESALGFLREYHDITTIRYCGDTLSDKMAFALLETSSHLVNVKLEFILTTLEPEAADIFGQYAPNQLLIAVDTISEKLGRKLAEIEQYTPLHLKFNTIDKAGVTRLAKLYAGDLTISTQTLDYQKIYTLITGKATSVTFELSYCDEDTADASGAAAKSVPPAIHLHIDKASAAANKILERNHVKLSSLSIKTVEAVKPGEKRSLRLPDAALQKIKTWLPLFERNPKFKHLVEQASAPLMEYLQKCGVTHPEYFSNLTANTDITPLLESFRTMDTLLPNDLRLTAWHQKISQRCGQGVLENRKLSAIYHDEILQAFYDHLCLIEDRLAESEEQFVTSQAKLANNSNLPAQRKTALTTSIEKYNSKAEQRLTIHTQLNTLKTALEALPLVIPGKVSYQLASRDVSELTLGDKCSDCTSATISGTNFWTVPVWLADGGMNFVLQYDEAGKLAHKFTVVWEHTGKELILTIDSAELGNDQKVKPGMNEPLKDLEQEQRLIDDAIVFMKDWLRKMGLPDDKLFATTVSNTGTKEFTGYPLVAIEVTKVGGMSCVQATRKLADLPPENKIHVYLQSYNPPPEPVATAVKRDRPPAEEIQRTIQQAEVALRNFLNQPQVDPADLATIQTILELAQTDYKVAARKMNVFLTMNAKEATQQQLSVHGIHLARFLNNAKVGMETFFQQVYAGAEIAQDTEQMLGKLVTTKLYHLYAPKPLEA